MGGGISKKIEDGAIVARGLFKSFNGNVAVDHVDLLIEKGEIFGLLGPNGAGKSTIIKMLTTMLKPSGGEAAVWGHHTWKLRRALERLRMVRLTEPVARFNGLRCCGAGPVKPWIEYNALYRVLLRREDYISPHHPLEKGDIFVLRRA